MSIEGPGLYQDDTGADIRSEFRELIGAGLTAHDATRDLLVRWADVLQHDDVYCAFHLALADTQWRLGRPVEAIRDVALVIIDTGRDLRRWEYSPPFHRNRQRILGELRERLVSAPPAPRTVRRSSNFATNLALGDVVRYTAEAGDSFILGVVGVDEANDQRVAIVRVIDRIPTPALQGLAATEPRVLPADHPIALMPYRGQDLPKRRTERFVGLWHVPARERHDGLVGCSAASWGSNLDWQLRKIVESDRPK